MPSHTITLTCGRSADQVSASVTLTADGEKAYDVAVPANTTHQLIALTLDVSQIQSLYLYSEQTLTLKTNSSGSPADTLTLTGGKPLVWYAGCGLDNPLGTDVTSLYATNGTATATTLQLRVTEDVTV